MEIFHKMESQGNWLFRRRSFIPLFLLAGGITVILLKNRDLIIESTWIWEGFCIILSFSGLAIRFYTIGQIPKGTSGNTTVSGQAANSLNTTGIYSIMRHPLYVGNFIIWSGLCLYLESPCFTLIYILLFWIYYERIMFAEEMFLKNKHEKEYKEWAAVTPGFIPSFKHWKANKMYFSWRHSISRECNGFFAIILTFSLFRTIEWLWFEQIETPGMFWYIFFLSGLFIFVILRILKKKTKVFKVEGR